MTIYCPNHHEARETPRQSPSYRWYPTEYQCDELHCRYSNPSSFQTRNYQATCPAGHTTSFDATYCQIQHCVYHKLPRGLWNTRHPHSKGLFCPEHHYLLRVDQIATRCPVESCDYHGQESRYWPDNTTCPNGHQFPWRKVLGCGTTDCSYNGEPQTLQRINWRKVCPNHHPLIAGKFKCSKPTCDFSHPSTEPGAAVISSASAPSLAAATLGQAPVSDAHESAQTSQRMLARVLHLFAAVVNMGNPYNGAGSRTGLRDIKVNALQKINNIIRRHNRGLMNIQDWGSIKLFYRKQSKVHYYPSATIKEELEVRVPTLLADGSKLEDAIETINKKLNFLKKLQQGYQAAFTLGIAKQTWQLRSDQVYYLEAKDRATAELYTGMLEQLQKQLETITQLAPAFSLNTVAHIQRRQLLAITAQLPVHLLYTYAGSNALLRAIIDLCGYHTAGTDIPPGFTNAGKITVFVALAMLTFAKVPRDVRLMQALANRHNPHRNATLEMAQRGNVLELMPMGAVPPEAEQEDLITDPPHDLDAEAFQELLDEIRQASIDSRFMKTLTYLGRQFAAFIDSLYSAANVYIIWRVVEIIVKQNANAQDRNDPGRYIMAAFSFIVVLSFRQVYFGLIKIPAVRQRMSDELCNLGDSLKKAFIMIDSILVTLPNVGILISETIIKYWQAETAGDDPFAPAGPNKKTTLIEGVFYGVSLILILIPTCVNNLRVVDWARAGKIPPGATEAAWKTIIKFSLAILTSGAYGAVLVKQAISLLQDAEYPSSLVPLNFPTIEGSDWAILSFGMAMFVILRLFLYLV